jgi:hypothetical protein
VATLSGGVLTWSWPWADPAAWNIFQSHDDGATFVLEEEGWPGDLREYVPADGTLPTYLIGVNAAGNPTTAPSLVVVPTFEPAALGAVAWWRADDLALGQGDPVQVWEDRIGELGLYYDSEAIAPTFDAVGLNGAPAVVFVGGDPLATTDLALGLSAPFSVAVVLRLEELYSMGLIVWGNQFTLAFNVYAAQDFYLDTFYHPSATGGEAWTLSQALALCATVGSEGLLYLNGAALSLSGSPGTGGGGLGELRLSLVGQAIVGAVAEVLVFNGALDASQVAALQGYFNERYAL